MKISRTTNYEIIAKLNRYVHELHTKLYPKYFNMFTEKSPTSKRSVGRR
jgi:diamine N-acetyltransferase